MALQDESVSWRVARAVREAVLKDEPAKAQCIADKVDEAVLRTLRKFDQSSVVQAHCLRLSGVLAYGNDLVSESLCLCLSVSLRPHPIWNLLLSHARSLL